MLPLRSLKTSNFDPNFYDPRMGAQYNNADGGSGTSTGAGAAGTQTAKAKPGMQMQVNVTMNNPNTTTALTVELFNWMTSFVRVFNATYVTGHYLYIPLLTYEGLAANTGGHGGTLGFDKVGNLEIHGDDSVPDAVLTVGCGETPYASFFEASAIIPFQVAFIRMTCKTDAQIDNQITWFQRTFSGGTTQNKISPRAYFKPNQFQNLTIDITAQFPVGIDAGIFVLVNALENLRHSLFINYWTRQVI